jgi:hypothetical protein
MHAICIYEPLPAILRDARTARAQGVVNIATAADGERVVRFEALPRHVGGEIDLPEVGRLFLAAVAAL